MMLAGSNLEVIDKFCYLGDMLDAGGGAESSIVTRVRSGWKKFMRDRYPCEELRAWVGIKPIVDVMRQQRLYWFGHIERREDNSWLKKVQNLAVDGHSGRGRPRKAWEHVIMEDLCVKGLRRQVAQNRVICHYMNSLTHACME